MHVDCFLPYNFQVQLYDTMPTLAWAVDQYFSRIYTALEQKHHYCNVIAIHTEHLAVTIEMMQE